MISSKVNTRAVQRHIINAMNRTLTQVAKEQKKIIVEKYGLKSKYINNKRIIKIRANSKRLEIKTLATNKYITPFMQKANIRKSISGYGIRKNRKNGGAFYISHKKRPVSGYTLGQGKIASKGSSKKRTYFYVKKITNLDIALKTEIKQIHKKAQSQLKKELDK